VCAPKDSQEMHSSLVKRSVADQIANVSLMSRVLIENASILAIEFSVQDQHIAELKIISLDVTAWKDITEIHLSNANVLNVEAILNVLKTWLA
jgi:hypothetical protein